MSGYLYVCICVYIMQMAARDITQSIYYLK